MTDQQNAALEPCPFCGGEAEMFELHLAYNPCKPCVRCKECWAMTRDKNTEAEAIAAWNRRPAPSGAEAVREAFENGKRVMLGFIEANGIADARKLCDHLATPQPAPTAAEDGLREFVESIVNAMGPYPDLNGHPIISAAYAALRSKPSSEVEP